MIKIKYLTSCSGSAGSFPAGSERELPKEKAMYLVSIKRAVLVDDKKTNKNEVPNISTADIRTNNLSRGKKPSKNRRK